MAPVTADPHEFFQTQNAAPGAAVEPSEADIAQGFAAGSNPSPLPKVFQPLTIRGVTAKNRIWVSPMCMYSSQDGFATDFHLAHYSQFAMHGAGLVMVEASGVLPEGRISPNCLGIWADEHVPGLRRVVRHMHQYGAVAGIQIAHSGRKGSTIPLRLYGTRPGFKEDAEHGGWPDNVYGPSAIAYDDGHHTPAEMTAEQIGAVTRAFADAARRADAAGFDVVELHAAHGYLLHEFLSPLSNRRTDKYGGSFENRTRLVREVAAAVRRVWPREKPLFARVSSTDWVEGGWTAADTVALARLLAADGVDLVDCSTGGNDPRQAIAPAPGYQVPFAARVRAEVPEVLTAAVGILTPATLVRDTVEEGRADAVFIGRGFLRNPSLTLTIARELGVNVAWSNQYKYSRTKTN
ncbi:hypothetical protein H4R18_000625 [Coemansia javaensis]|uniref:NADH:flavin oxidoreductase/NADH oxidase N-terminal domain-containing protein n=1 Tax=Coemansia javaensis TaxID=2761396 RepID=A0A9W8HHR9_9FUNG|nr:hypothetical protein H4R18_000625 [Coemansia javaensis]